MKNLVNDIYGEMGKVQMAELQQNYKKEQLQKREEKQRILHRQATHSTPKKEALLTLEQSNQ